MFTWYVTYVARPDMQLPAQEGLARITSDSRPDRRTLRAHVPGFLCGQVLYAELSGVTCR